MPEGMKENARVSAQILGLCWVVLFTGGLGWPGAVPGDRPDPEAAAAIAF